MRAGELVIAFLLTSIVLGGVALKHFADMLWAQPAFFASVGVFLACFVRMLTAQAAASLMNGEENEEQRI